ncbi:hypothetical protein S83_044960 [Arachis hypogaea]|nr:uncharacterized protein DS421_13g433810 [Arachis hypogaea]
MNSEFTISIVKVIIFNLSSSFYIPNFNFFLTNLATTSSFTSNFTTAASEKYLQSCNHLLRRSSTAATEAFIVFFFFLGAIGGWSDSIRSGAGTELHGIGLLNFVLSMYPPTLEPIIPIFLGLKTFFFHLVLNFLIASSNQLEQ